jgi:large subunit ribosomal protein L10
LAVPLNRENKQAMVAEITSRLAHTKTMVLAEYRGMTVEELTQLRVAARAEQVYLRVLKNTLMRRAVADTAFAALAERMVGPLIYGMSDDAVAAARVIDRFAKSNDKLIIQSGAYDGKCIDREAVQALASIPAREILLARLLGVMQAPVAGFARLLGALSQKKQDQPA